MKRFFIFVLLVSRLSAQWIVNDPVNTAVNSAVQAGQAANHLEVLRQWTQQFEAMTRQLRELQDQLAVQRRIRDVIGDPSAAGGQVVLRELGAEDLARQYGETLAEVRRLATAIDSLQRTANGVYAQLENKTSLGRSFEREEQLYRRFAAVDRLADNLATVEAETNERRVRLQREIADTLERLKAASTQAEADKLHATLTALNGQLAQLESLRRQEADKLWSAQVQNENQAAKERQDLLERQLAEERDSVHALNQWQRSLRLTPTNYRQQ